MYFRGLWFLWLVWVLTGCQVYAVATVPTELARLPLAYPYLTAVNSQTGLAYVINGLTELQVISGDKIVAEFETLQADPMAIAIDEERNWIYIVNKRGNSVTVLQGSELKGNISLNAAQLEGITIDPHTGWAYVISSHILPADGSRRLVWHGKVTVLMGTEIIHEFDFGDFVPLKIVFEPVNQEIYLVGKEIVVLKGLQELTRLAIEDIQAIDVNPRTGDIFALTADYELLQLRNKNLIATFKPQEGYQPLQTLLIHPTTGDIYVGAMKPTEVFIIRDTDEGLAVIGRVPLPLGPHAMTADPVTGNVYVANSDTKLSGANITVINGLEKIAEIPNAGGFIQSFGVNTQNGRLYIPDGDAVSILGFEE